MTKRYKSILTLQRRMPVYKNPAIAAVVQDQQLERLNFATGLRNDPAGYSQFQQKNINAILTDVTKRKQNAFQKAQIDLGRYMDMEHNVNFYKTRSGDVNALTGVMLENNNKIQHEIRKDKDNSKRQFEINEWYNYDKLETLFFLQIVFMVSLSIAIVMYWSKQGLITAGFAGILYGILGLTVIGVGVHKYFYTKNTRDVKLWHRRRFDKAPPPPSPICGPSNDLLGEAEKLLEEGEDALNNCANNIDSGLAGINAAAVAEVSGIENGRLNLLEQLGTSVCGAVA